MYHIAKFDHYPHLPFFTQRAGANLTGMTKISERNKKKFFESLVFKINLKLK